MPPRPWHSFLETLGLSPPSSQPLSSPPTTNPLPFYRPISNSDTDMDSPTTTSTTTTPPTSPLPFLPPPSSPDKPSSNPPRTYWSPKVHLPTLPRFLADFTLGFADGLTVPFALTAGLSSLGRTDTVVYAGMAEICAGSISMGIGGYLAARGEVKVGRGGEVGGEVGEGGEEEKGLLVAEGRGSVDGAVRRYLDLLELQGELREAVARHVWACPGVLEGLMEESTGAEEAQGSQERLPSPLIAGVSVALGYLLGGIIPLFPYFLVSQVKEGMVWSFGVCAVALFVFGFCKDFALSGQEGDARGSKRGWRDIRHSAWEGVQMVVLGSVAALAAVLCVRAFEGMNGADQGEHAS